MCLAQTIRNFKKIVAKQWETMGDVDIDIIPLYYQGPHSPCIYISTLQGEESKVVDPPEEITDWPRIDTSATRESQACRRDCLYI